MQESHGEGIASHADPESCAGSRKAPGEALTGEHMGRPSSCEITTNGEPTLFPYTEGNIVDTDNGEVPAVPAQSETPCTCGSSLHGTREIPETSDREGRSERSEKARGRTADTNASGKSDDPVVPEKRPNKGGETPPAEAVEGRGSTEGNVGEEAADRARKRATASNRLSGVRKRAREDKRVRFTTLLHHITVSLLRESFYKLKRRSAPGVDGMTWKEYAVNEEERLSDLHDRVHRGSYRAKPSKRTYIPKADGRRRPLGIASLEDKIVQQAVVTVLNQIYEEDFLGYSYGFRPGRSPHHALDALSVGIMERKVNWVLDADIRSFFDTLDHEWLMKFIEHRIADRRILRLILKWLRAGVSEEGQRSKTTVGTPQGAVISPLLANVYLHYVLDLWVKAWREKEAKGDMIMTRFADDFVLGFQHRADAERFRQDLAKRLADFGLELHPEKTRLIEFGRFARSNRSKTGEGKPESFDFLGFTHSCGVTRKSGKFKVLRRTKAKTLRRKLTEIKAELRKRMHHPIPALGRWLKSVFLGHMRYFSVPDNIKAISAFRRELARHWLTTLRQRSQKDRMTWERFKCILMRWLPKARVLHPYPNVRFHVRYPR